MAAAPATRRTPHARGRRPIATVVVLMGAMVLPCALGFMLPAASPSPSTGAAVVSSAAARMGGPAATSTTALFVKREGRRGPGYKGGSGGGGSGGSGGGGGGYRGGRPGGRRRDAGAEPSKDPEKRLANLNRKLTSIIEVCAKGEKLWVW